MPDFSVGMGGPGYNPTAMDAMNALLQRAPAYMEEGMQRKRTAAWSAEKDAAQRRELAEEEEKRRKQAILDQKREKQMLIDRADREEAEKRQREIAVSGARSLRARYSGYQGVPGTTGQDYGALLEGEEMGRK